MSACVTIGAGLGNPEGRLVELAGPAVRGLAALLAQQSGLESWWSAHTYADGYRKADNWLSCRFIAIDVDYEPVPGAHVPRPPESDAQLSELARRGDFPGHIFYLTPRGFRLIFALSDAITNAARFKDVAAGAGKLAKERLAALGLTSYHVDDGALTDRARLLYTPRATVKGHARTADVIVMREAETDSSALAPPAPVFEMVSPRSKGIADAVGRYVAEHPREYPTQRSDCPICKHRGCWGQLANRPGRWSCFSSNHTEGGVKGETAWTGDALDLDAWAAGITPAQLLRDGGYLPKPGSEGPPASVDSLEDDSVFASNSAWSIQRVLEMPFFREKVLGAGLLEWDEKNLVPTLDRRPLPEETIFQIRAQCERHVAKEPGKGLKFSKDLVSDALTYLAKRRPFNAVRDYLLGLQWDGLTRIENVAEEILHVEPTPLNQAIIRRWFVSAVARALEPGCKVDTVLILAGPQGIGKSTFFDVLGSPWFSDTSMSVGAGSDPYLQLHRAWIYEWSELEAMQRSRSINAVKAFLTSRVDNFRAPYDRRPAEHPRSCVIVGTTNEEDFLTDPTGNRRYWIIRVHEEFNTEKLRSWRDQLWAEAVRAKLAREPWILSPEEDRQLDAIRHESLRADVWQERIEDYLIGNPGPVTVQDILEHAIGKAVAQCDRSDQMRVAAILRSLGYERSATPIALKGSRARRWVKKET